MQVLNRAAQEFAGMTKTAHLHGHDDDDDDDDIIKRRSFKMEDIKIVQEMSQKRGV